MWSLNTLGPAYYWWRAEIWRENQRPVERIESNVDVLTLTATPIPRTLHFSLRGARRLEYHFHTSTQSSTCYDRASYFDEDNNSWCSKSWVRRGGQRFFGHTRVSDIEQVANVMFQLVPDSRIGIAHGQMARRSSRDSNDQFIEGE